MRLLSSAARVSLAVFVTLFLGVSCAPGVPVVAPTGTLALKDPNAKGPITDGPFRVVFASPQGETTDPSEVDVVFSRPMRPLDLAGEEKNAPLTLTSEPNGKAPRGEFRWLGTSALTFSATEPLARATSYKVKVPAGTAALDGAKLDKDFAFEFTTARPRLVRTEPASGFDHFKPTDSIELLFDQPIALREVEAHVTFVAESKKSSKPIRARATYPKPDVRTRIKVTPATPLPLQSTIALVVDENLRGEEGPLPSGKETESTFQTYGPLGVAALECYRDTPHKKCAAIEGVRLEFKNRVRFADVRKFVSIDPPVALKWAAQDAARGSGDQLVSIVYLPATLAPATSYRITVRAGIKDEYGQALARPETMSVETDDEWPDVDLGLAGTVLDLPKSTTPPPIPVATVNVTDLEVAAAPLDELSYTQLVFNRSGSWFSRVHAVSGAVTKTLRMGAADNGRKVQNIDLANVIGRPVDRGIFALAVRGPGRHGATDRGQTLAVTDLGISAKMSRFGSVVWVTSLRTGKPLANVAVSVRTKKGTEPFTGVTDSDGLVTIPAERFDASRVTFDSDDDAIVFARSGTDLAARRVGDMISPWRADVNVDVAGNLKPMGFVFTDRGVYRPGETVRAKGLFRVPTARGTTTPVGKEIRMRVYDPEAHTVFDQKLKLGEFGEFAVDIPIPATAHLGTIEVRADIGTERLPGSRSSDDRSDPHGVAITSAELAAYKASEFKVAIESDRPSYVRGDRATWITRGDYLFGAPMKGGKARVSVHRGQAYFPLPLGEKAGEEEYVWTDDVYFADKPESGTRASLVTTAEGVLGDKGDLVTATALALPEQRGTETLNVEAEVEDLTRQTISAQSSTIVHPGEFYVALARPKDGFATEGTKVDARFFAVEPSGKKRSGVSVALELVRRSWTSVMRGAGDANVTHETRVVDEVVDRCTGTSSETLAGCALTPKSGGYHIVRATARDGRSNVVGASYRLYVLAAREDAGPSWPSTDDSAVELVPDKKSYDVGDVATVLVKNPYPEAEALVTLERAGIYKTERRTLKGATPTIKVPITADMHPNVFVGVHLVRPRTKERAGTGADTGAPAYRIGYAPLAIRPEERRLKVALTPSAKELRPGSEVEVDVAVTDRKGAPVRANATIYAVDEGVLILTGYRTPDPLPTFNAPRPLAVFALESRSDLARIFKLSPAKPGGDKGGEGGGGGNGMRADFRATAYFQPSLLVEKGHAKVRFKLPDGLTTYRLMAVVADAGDRFGFGESQVVTSRRLMARPAMPRFLRAGDAVDAGIIVTSKGMPATNVDVALDAKGIEVEGPTTQRVALAPSGQAEARFRLKPTRAGDAVLAFRVQTDGTGGVRENDAVQVTKKIEIPTSMESVALAGATEHAAAEALGDLRLLRTDVGGLELNLSSSALVGLDGAVKQLLEYPYGCVEQMTSKLIPLVVASDLLPFVGATPPADAKRTIDTTIAKILAAQHGDGSFGYWVDTNPDPWVTAYATWTLGDAKQRGYAVPEEALEKARRAVRDRAPTLVRTKRLAEAAFAADVLAEAGEPDGGLQTQLYEARDKLPLFARALLAHAYAVGADSKRLEATRPVLTDLMRDVGNHVRPTPTGAMVVANAGSEYAPLLDSDARTTAMVLRALVTANKNDPLAGRLARGLVGAREGGSFRSTQEAGWALVGLDAYRRAQESGPVDFDARVFFGERVVKESHFASPGAISASLGMADVASGRTSGGMPVTFQVLGQGRLYYEARLRYARRELPTDTLDRGFFVKKTVRAVKPEAIAEALRSMPTTSTNTLNAGDLVLVDLHVVSTSPRSQVVIDDALPAGFEAIDSRLKTSSSAAATVENASANPTADMRGDVETDDAEDERAMGRAENDVPFHREVKDDRVLTFLDHLPAGIFHTRYLARATSRGRYLVPPTRVECMYEPEVFGRTAGQTFEVR